MEQTTTDDELLFQQYLTIEKEISWEEGQIYRDDFFAGLRYARAFIDVNKDQKIND